MSLHDTVAPAVLNSAEIADLAERVARVLLPDDAGYQAECATFNLMTPVRPAVAVGATSVADVQAAVRFAGKRACRWQSSRPGIRWSAPPRARS
jgi:hypothetical protein